MVLVDNLIVVSVTVFRSYKLEAITLSQGKKKTFDKGFKKSDAPVP